ncbi:MAG: PhoH family protein [bacterium]|nr:PhoH family protein [bacterium]
MASKILVLDTSAIISLVQNVTTFREEPYPGFAGVLGDNEIVVPRVVLDELDRLKSDKGDRGKIAIEAARQLEEYTNCGCLLDGVETEKGGLLRIAPRPTTEKVIAWGLKANVADHEILATTLEIEDSQNGRDSAVFGFESSKEPTDVVLITQDRILRVLARSVYSVQAEELKSVWAPEMHGGFGYRHVELEAETMDQVFDSGVYNPEKRPIINELFHIVDQNSPEERYCYGIARVDGDKRYVEVIDRAKVDYLKVAGDVTGKNVRQRLLLWALMGCGEPDPMAEGGIRLITVAGPAGSGKSFLTLAAAWERLERGHFERIVITRPMVEVGASLGFLPGSLDEKVRPWGGPIEDNLRAIVQVPGEAGDRGKRGVQRAARPFDAKNWLEMENRLEMVPLSHIRGRTFRRSFVILEEAQNLERGPLKVLLTRLGEGSVIVVIGDKSQIDNQFLSTRNNGLVHAINAFRSWPQAVHIELEKIVRSDLADAATRLL